MRKFTHALFAFTHALFAFTLAMPAGCDDVELREAPDEVLVGSDLITIGDFADLVAECDEVEKVELTVTLSSYPLGAKHRVIGLGFSTLAALDLYQCYRKQLVALGAEG